MDRVRPTRIKLRRYNSRFQKLLCLLSLLVCLPPLWMLGLLSASDETNETLIFYRDAAKVPTSIAKSLCTKFNQSHDQKMGASDSKSLDDIARILFKYFELEGCDDDCLLLQCELLHWPEGKPKAFIYYLTIYFRMEQFLECLTSVDEFFNDEHRYPVVIFDEIDQVPNYEEYRAAVRRATKSRVYFQPVHFEIPEFLPENLIQISCDLISVGYRHMCRFHARTVYDHPIMRGFEYVWRLDDDSRLSRPVKYDLFEFMRDGNLLYGYVLLYSEKQDCIVGLWEVAESYVANLSVVPTFFREWDRSKIIYNNFEISRISFWLSDDYQRYIDYIDRLGGIYYHRWGDAPIKTIGVSLFIPKDRVHRFADIGYEHQGYKN